MDNTSNQINNTSNLGLSGDHMIPPSPAAVAYMQYIAKTPWSPDRPDELTWLKANAANYPTKWPTPASASNNGGGLYVYSRS